MRAALAALACLLVAVAWGANRSARQGPARTAVRSRTAAKAARPPAAKPAAASAWHYDAVLQRNLFMPPASQRQAKSGALPALPPMPIDAFDLSKVGTADAAAGAAAPQSPQWTYAGYATVNGNAMAIVEDATSKKAEFLSVGQTFNGATVKSISPQALQLGSGGDTTEMKISDAFTATPLNEPPKPTPAAGANQGGRGQGGLPGGGRGGRFLQRMLQNNPDLATQAYTFMQSGVPPNQPTGGGRGPGQPQGGQQ
jgi:hypothetical protein